MAINKFIKSVLIVTVLTSFLVLTNSFSSKGPNMYTANSVYDIEIELTELGVFCNHL